MTKVLVGNIGSYTFDASAKTVTLTGLPTLTIEQILLITNVKDTSNEVIYQFDLPSKSGTISGNVITLVYDTAAMSDTDPLQIWVDINSASVPSAFLIQGTSGNQADVNVSGELKVINATPTPPPATTPVLDSHLDSDNAILDNFYLIPSGQVLTLQLFRSGSEGTAIISAYICDDGTNPNDLTEPLAISYLAINNDTQPLNIDITGDGTRTVRLRREPAGGGGNREMYVAITGFLT
jgi:hypothetical protein